MASQYDNHRFDNPSAWLDREERAKARREGRPLGYGYAIPKQHLEPRPEKSFYAQEYAFTSGNLVNRRYAQFTSMYPTENERADPWHYPNYMKVEDQHHWRPHKRRSQNYDPRFWQPDPALSDVVPESLVQQKVAAERDELRAGLDPKRIGVLFSDDVRPQAGTLHELNVDLSCVSLPEREGGSSPSARGQFRKTPAPSKMGLPAATATGDLEEEQVSVLAAGQGPGEIGMAERAGEDKWKWCLGGRPPQTHGRPTTRDTQMAKSRSDGTLLSGKSTLPGNIGGPSSPFHGLATRKFGIRNNWDGRMRGGQMAREGWAGTFPARDMR